MTDGFREGWMIEADSGLGIEGVPCGVEGHGGLPEGIPGGISGDNEI